jgi:threonine aldolase
VWIDFTKGLGAPIGAVLAGSAADIDRARRLKHAFGGALRQAGIAAAGCLHALDEHVDRLADDHANARRLASGLARIPGIRPPARPPETNIVFFEPAPGGPSAAELVARCARRGLGLGAVGPRVRAVTHLDVGVDDIDRALRIVAEALAES